MLFLFLTGNPCLFHFFYYFCSIKIELQWNESITYFHGFGYRYNGIVCWEKESNIIIAPKPVVKVRKQTLKMSEYEQSRSIEWLGATYKVVVKREADDSLPLVKVDENTKYHDNKITVRIIRSDGSEFFKRSFTKAAFEKYLDSHTKTSGGLLGIVYVKTEGNNLCFAASVGSPDVMSDEYLPLVVKISKMGEVSISKDQLLDTEGNDSSPSGNSSVDEDDDEGV